MKVMIITDAWHPQVNGVVRTYEFLTAELIKRGHDVRIIAPSDFPVLIPMPGYNEIKLAITPYKRLARMIGDYAPDAIHVATEGPLGWAARKYCKRHKRPYSTSFHTHFPDYVAKRVSKFLPKLSPAARNFARSLVMRFHAPATCMMIATKSLEDELKSWDFKTPMVHLSRGVDLSQFHTGKAAVFQDLKKPIALYVGRIAIEKNLDDFLSMDWDGSKVVVGDGPSRSLLERRYPQAIFAGIKQGAELADIYRAADVFVFPSRTDTFGIVLIEAMASGLPIAAYNVTGPKDIVTEPFLGALSEDNLADAARKAIECGDPEQRARHARAHYTWENAARQFEDGLKLTLEKTGD